MLLGFDAGYYKVKSVHSNNDGSNRKNFDFVSQVGTPDKSMFSIGGNNNDIVTWGEKSFAVGETALNHSALNSRTESWDWFSSDSYLALYYSALSKVTKASRFDARIVTGLPVSFYESGKDTMKDILSGDHSFTMDGRDSQRVNSIVKVIPQPMGTTLNYILSNTGAINPVSKFDESFGIKSRQNIEITVIDIGSNTLNVIKTKGTSIVGQPKSVSNEGVWRVVKWLSQELDRKLPGHNLTDNQVNVALQEKQLIYNGIQDISEIVDQILQQYSNHIVSLVSTIDPDIKKSQIVLISGGGAYLIGKQLLKVYKNGWVIDNPELSNSYGYWKLAKYWELNDGK